MFIYYIKFNIIYKIKLLSILYLIAIGKIKNLNLRNRLTLNKIIKFSNPCTLSDNDLHIMSTTHASIIFFDKI